GRADPRLWVPGEKGGRVDQHTVTRMTNRAGAAAGLPHIHRHQLRHTLATQAINRGMSLEAIAALLGHRSLDMTLRYAKIASRTVADEYFAVTEKVEALYGQPAQLPADAAGPKMARLRRQHHPPLPSRHGTLHPPTPAALPLRSAPQTLPLLPAHHRLPPPPPTPPRPRRRPRQRPPPATIRLAAHPS